MVEAGDTVTWEYGSGLGSGRATGEVLETGIEKFGYDDIIRVDTGDDEVYIQPEAIV